MAQQQPAVVIIARHGLRLDASDPSWHLSTPAPYDPPLTYGGWTQCRALGGRIATLLHRREQDAAARAADKSVKPHDAALNGRSDDAGTEERPRKRRRIRHKVVIHTSPFLRCLQTSVAIAAGMAQYKPSIETGRPRTSSSHGSPRLKPTEGHVSPALPPIAEPDLAHKLARKVLQPPKRYRKSALRVDAFLGEWLNPEYYDQILPPPPSPMMMTTAKAELMENDPVEIFTPSVSQKSSSGSLWNGANPAAVTSRESPLDDWSPVEDAVPTSPVSPSRRRASQSSVGSGIDRPKSPFRPGSTLQPLTSTVPKQEVSVYHPPQPQYAVSTSDPIPRGYVTHARNACANVDYQWDSSRPPQNWGDGGEYGEEWSAMHKRFRRGLNHLIHWYSQHDADDRGEDALGLDQAEQRPHSRGADEEEQEDLVVIMVTHGAGCNALIGALTGQPVLLDVGMASLTVAVRKDDAPPVTTYASSTAPSPGPSPLSEQMILGGNTRRGSIDLGLSSIYEMKLIASTEHLRPAMASPSMRPVDATREPFLAHSRQRFGAAFDPSRSNTSTALGSIRRPSAANALAPPSGPDRSVSLPPGGRLDLPSTPPMSTGLWTPPAGRTPNLRPQVGMQSVPSAEGRPGLFTAGSGSAVLPPTTPGDNMMLDSSTIGSDSRPGSSVGHKMDYGMNGTPDTSRSNTDGTVPELERSMSSDGDVITELPLPSPGDSVPTNLSRGLSQKALWGAQPKGARVERKGREAPKRRWTVDRE